MEDIELTLEKNGFCGVFHEGDKFPNSVIIRVAGSGAGKERVIACGQFLVDAGYSVLFLGYYLWEGQTNIVDQIPIDYVSKAIQWLRKYKNNSKLKIGMTGMSQGASYTLSCASKYSDITSVVAVSPFDYVTEGITGAFKPTGHACYTWNGEEEPYTEWKLLKRGLLKPMVQLIFDENYGLSRMMRYAYDHNPINENSRIKVENMNCNLLLLATQDDDCWPSEIALRRIEERLRKVKYPYIVESYIYERGCHNMGGDMDIDSKNGKKLKRLMRAWSDHPQECRACIMDSKKRILEFFARTLV